MSEVHDVCVIGAGPAGIAVAIRLSELGHKVALVESGFENFNATAQELSNAELTNAKSHALMTDAVVRILGGTSAVWGGRCVPYDPIDFETRDYVEHSGWPITNADLRPYYISACEFLGVGEPSFNVRNCTALETRDLLFSDTFRSGNSLCGNRLERWSQRPRIWSTYRSRVLRNRRIDLISGFTCIGFLHGVLGNPVSHALLLSTLGGETAPRKLNAQQFVIACGGIESTRLILNSIKNPQGIKVPVRDIIGRFYMGHPSGKIADIELAGDPSKTIFNFEKDGNVYVRRRITFPSSALDRESLLNIAFWLDNPNIADPQHGNGVLSAAYLAIASPLFGRYLAPAAIRNSILKSGVSDTFAHLKNCLVHPFDTVGFCTQFAYRRYIRRPRLPGFFVHNRTNRYALHFHSEQVPNRNNEIALIHDKDKLGLRRVRITLEWSPQDLDSIVRAHVRLDKLLVEQGIGRLWFRYPMDTVSEAIRQQAVDGFHQIGTLRMGNDPRTSATDCNGRIRGTTNVFVASSAVFPTSGQANPTLTLIAFALKQSEYIHRCLKL